MQNYQNPEFQTGQGRDLVLPPGWQAFIQDKTKGSIRTAVGPFSITPTAQDQPVRYEHKQRAYHACKLEEVSFKVPEALEGEYLVLENPVETSKLPDTGTFSNMPELRIGRRVNIPGPCVMPVWPGQDARKIDGHRLRFNQYLIVRVYNEDEARANWSKAITRKTESGEEQPIPSDLAVGKQYVVKGRDVSFYIPPTGLEVVPNANGSHVQDALTLERMEYCILIDESGKKTYPRGETVVFPEPTQRFVKDSDGNVKFRAIELNEIQGLYLKAIADYEGDYGEAGAGEELFITGETVPIFFPCAELQIIAYGGHQKNFAVAIPSGEGRYVMTRLTGEMETMLGGEKGRMILLDPRYKVFVRRILSKREVELWYPGNEDALAHNLGLARLSETLIESSQPSFVSDASVRQFRTKSLSTVDAGVLGETLQRGTKFSPPRAITLDTKYDGVPSIRIWTGYAVLVIDKRGNRRIVEGGNTVLLNYDEMLESIFSFVDEETVYLSVKNNKVSFHVGAEVERVPIEMEISVIVDFDGDKSDLWFNVRYPGQLLRDRLLSILRSELSKISFDDFWQHELDFVRKSIFGEQNEFRFSENGMIVKNIELLSINVKDSRVAEPLITAQRDAVSGNVRVFQLRKALEVEKEASLIETERRKLFKARIADELQIKLAQYSAAESTSQAEIKANTATEEIIDLTHTSRLKRERLSAEQKRLIDEGLAAIEAQRLTVETDAVIKRVEVAKGEISQAILALHDKETLIRVAEATSVQNLIGGKNLVQALVGIFKDTGLQKVVERIIDSNKISVTN